jgi:polysaccharide biosynthesis protein PslJ
MYATNPLQEWIARLDRRTYAILIGISIGASGGLIGLLLAVAGPIITFGALVGLFAGLYVITNVNAALYGIIAVMAMLPFGTFPFRIGFTPTLMDAAMGAFLLVYLVQWMTGRRHSFRITPIHGVVALFTGWMILSFLLGIQYARPTSAILRQFAETLLSISLVFILVDLMRDAASLRRLVLIVMIAVGVQALIAVVLWAAPDDLTESMLIRLAPIGYPDGGVIRYIEDNPDDMERAIGTWVDPNVLGGFLAISAALIAPQVFARRPVLRTRWIAWGVLGVVGVALLLTASRASMLGFGAGLFFIGLFKGYRRFLVLLLLGVSLVFVLPQTQGLVERFIEAFTAQDLATQMRLGEYGDALELISRYPIAGVGFTGTPEIDLYTDVASMYLIMANQIGLVGVALFALLIIGVFAYGAKAWRAVQHDSEIRSIYLGCHAALITVLLNGIADHYFFRLDFHASVTLLWLVIALSLASSRLAFERELTVAKPAAIM